GCARVRGVWGVGERLEDDGLPDLEGRGAGQIVVRPDGNSADLLVRSESRVRGGDDVVRRRWVLEQEHGVDLQARPDRPADDGTVLDPWILPELAFDVLGVALLSVAQAGHDILDPAA